jgi:hypothetical protein
VAVAAQRFREVLGVSSHADGMGHSVDLGTTALALEPASGTPAGPPARLVLAAGSRRRLDVRAAHGAVLDLG